MTMQSDLDPPRNSQTVMVTGVLRNTLTDDLYRQWGKRVFDLFFVLMLLPILLPVVAVAALALWIEGGVPFYSQLRLGQGGRVFRIWKLRTMHADADRMLRDLLARDPARRDEWDRTQKLKVDPRVTTLGQFFRRVSIDELPQFLNVLTGDMSLIGPRPMMLDQRQKYGPNIAAYLALRPGISGKWQVSERNDAEFTRRAEIDAEYERDLSLRSDCAIFVQTLRTVIRSTGY